MKCVSVRGEGLEDDGSGSLGECQDEWPRPTARGVEVKWRLVC